MENLHNIMRKSLSVRILTLCFLTYDYVSQLDSVSHLKSV
jgi:hypothetical protein